MSRPDQAFPQARQLNRKIFIHHGPPNSGKTHSSLLKLIQAKSGVYCAPLRLMAYEIFDKLTRAGIKTNLLTGQKRMIDSESSHLVCTVEMLPIGKSFDVGIIDEMQMVADESRGFAWCRAFFALQVCVILLCDCIFLYLCMSCMYLLNGLINALRLCIMLYNQSRYIKLI